jgi:hypothetical protein
MQHITLPSAKALHLPFCSAVRGRFPLPLRRDRQPAGHDDAGRGRPFRSRPPSDGEHGEVWGACGLGFADTVKFTIMLADMRRWTEFNAVYLSYFDP